MDAVFRVADRITVMVNGAVIASDVPDSDPHRPEVRDRLPRARSTDHERDAARSTGLHTYYGDSHVLRGVSLEIPAGVSLGLLGRNGMGKTTLIRTADGLRARRPAARSRWHGRDVTGAPPEKMARLRHRLRAGRPRHLPQPLGAREPGDDARAPAPTARATGPSSACWRPSRAWPSGSSTAASSSRAASSRCCRSAAR